MNVVTFTQAFAAAVANGICLSQSATGAQALTLNGSLVTSGVAYLDASNHVPNIGSPAAARRVLVTSAGNDSGITFTISGADRYGNALSEVLAGGNAAAVYTLNDFATVTSVATSGATASTVTVGTNGVGSSPWRVVEIHDHVQIDVAAAVTNGSANWTVEHTRDDPNWQPTPWNTTVEPNSIRPPRAWPHPTLQSQTGSAEGSYVAPIVALRLTTNSGTGTVQAWFTQANIFRR